MHATTHSRVMVTVFPAKALYGHWTSKYAHDGHHICSRGDHMVSSSRHVSVFSWWHWRTLHFMRASYFVDDTYGHCIWSESTIWSLDFRISSSRSPHTFCRANQHVVGWLGGQWFLLNWIFRICQTSQIFTLENPKATIILEWRGYIWIYIVHEYILKNMQLTSVHAWFQI